MKEQDVFINFSGLCTEQYEPLSNLPYLALCPRKWTCVDDVSDASRSSNLCSIDIRPIGDTWGESEQKEVFR